MVQPDEWRGIDDTHLIVDMLARGRGNIGFEIRILNLSVVGYDGSGQQCSIVWMLGPSSRPSAYLEPDTTCWGYAVK